jgi:hypothetical protein
MRLKDRLLGITNIKIKDAPDIRLARYPAFFYFRYPTGYQIDQPDIQLMYSWSNDFLIFFLKYRYRVREEKIRTKTDLVTRSCSVFCLLKTNC